MGEQYDDWGNPVVRPRYEPRDQSLVGTLRHFLTLAIRRYRTLLATVLFALCLLFYWNTAPRRAPKVVPTDWSRFAYVQYVTDNHNLCNSYMVFEALHRYGSKAERVMLYPDQWDMEDESPQDRNSQLLIRAQKLWKVKLRPVSLLDTDGKAQPGTLNAPSSWATSITKLRAFELGEYDRVLHIDSDVTLLQHLDELFLAPKAQVAMPRAYWSDDVKPNEWPLTSLLMLIEPNPLELRNFIDILMSWKIKPGFQVGRNYDMDLLNHRFGASAMVLPHRPYAMLSAEFRRKDHSAYLGTINGPRALQSKYEWDPDRALAEAKLVHFSDWPLPKPWVMWPHEGVAEMQPDCDGKPACRDRTVWKNLYDDFRRRRKDLCRILSVPAPSWSDLKNKTAPV
ncbi:glycosyltransferase family 8 protein [Dothistroma septosporum NZE10]|uniref:Glycosyltransferase family 8 protein n=1 Tax=Dothistroma septosporum (strain NZE10 / CBS 128990) TaxID=675120 RepID=N1PK88_DOTSN|nr:glycosyltransferase family 8 protein [Dothistroma septosporum NZE10]